jgi:hypothetical protein
MRTRKCNASWKSQGRKRIKRKRSQRHKKEKTQNQRSNKSKKKKIFNCVVRIWLSTAPLRIQAKCGLMSIHVTGDMSIAIEYISNIKSVTVFTQGFMCIVVRVEIPILRAAVKFRLYMKFRSSCGLDQHHRVYGTISRVALVSDFIVFTATLRASQFQFSHCVVEWEYHILQELSKDASNTAIS